MCVGGEGLKDNLKCHFSTSSTFKDSLRQDFSLAVWADRPVRTCLVISLSQVSSCLNFPSDGIAMLATASNSQCTF